MAKMGRVESVALKWPDNIYIYYIDILYRYMWKALGIRKVSASDAGFKAVFPDCCC